ncbi:MAG: hypothetical protein E4H13_00250 [Calditrichales bacterium]|nr:MAG: hypothetical protein E4H13_00250 [Calditrichales bacterium]
MMIVDREKIRGIFPDNSIQVKLNPNNPPTASNLTLTKWKVIMQVDGKKSLQQIIDELQLGEDESLSIFYELFEQEFIQIIPQKMQEAVYAEPDFFVNLENILINIIGPVAVYVINDVMWELNQAKDKFLVNDIPSLTESISREISDESKRVQFQKEMLRLIKTYEIC